MARDAQGRKHKMTRRRWGILFAVLGTAMVAAAALLFSYNMYDDAKAGQKSSEALAELSAKIADPAAVDTSGEGFLVDGRRYCGYLEIPSQDLALPVLANFSDEGLHVAPCRYSGSLEAGNFVIAAYSYASQFGCLSSVAPGERVLFTSADGTVTRYRVDATEVVNPEEIERVVDSKWELSLFSCTYGGAQRVVVRCQEEDDQ